MSARKASLAAQHVFQEGSKDCFASYLFLLSTLCVPETAPKPVQSPITV